MKTMKKSMFIAAMAAMVLAGCTKDESIVEQQEIGFQPLAYKASQTKANVITGATYGTDAPSFGLFAYQLTEGTFDANKADAKLYIDKKEVSYTDTDGNWRTNPKSFWPLQGSLTFIAYSPYSVKDDVTHSIDVSKDNEGNVTSANSVLIISDFEAGTTGQKDLMWSTHTKDQTSNGSVNNYPEASPTYAGVPILFNHALCRIKITAKTAEDYSGFATYNLKQIQVVGLKDKATLTVTDDAAVWSDVSNDLTTFDFYAPATYKVLSANSVTVTYMNAETAGNGLLAIPQSLEGVTLKVTYTMTVDPDGNGSASAVVTETTKDVVLKTGTLTELLQNKVYTLNLSISADEILYSPDVVAWDETGSGDYTVPEVQ